MGRVKVIELRLEHAFFIGLNRMEVEAVNNEVAALKEPLQIVFLGSLEGAYPLPTVAALQSIIHWNRVRVDAIHDRGEAVLIELPNVEEGEVQHLPDSIPEGIQPDVGCFRVFPEGGLRLLNE